MKNSNNFIAHDLMKSIGKNARAAATELAFASTKKKDDALRTAAADLRKASDYLASENAKDINIARAIGSSKAFLDRLLLTQERIENISVTLELIADLRDPIGVITDQWDRPNGLSIERVRAPIGVIGVIYESRPNVTADASGLCLKAGNAVILRGGAESFNSCSAIMKSLEAGLKNAGLPEYAIQFIPTPDRSAIDEMLKLDEYIDVLVPRGGKSLLNKIHNDCKIPQFKHLDGICHTYIHESADLEIARKVTFNAKMRRTGICGATETILIDRSIATNALKPILSDLFEAGCIVRGDKKTCSLDQRVEIATIEDWNTEYLDSTVSIRQVENIFQALEHIADHGSKHTDSIITTDKKAANFFLNRVDSAIAMVNTSTQFADGGEFGMGAEIGIATGKLHARGPIGLKQLTTFKYVVRGSGQVRP